MLTHNVNNKTANCDILNQVAAQRQTRDLFSAGTRAVLRARSSLSPSHDETSPSARYGRRVSGRAVREDAYIRLYPSWYMA